MAIGILDSHLSPVELNVHKSTSQLLRSLCSGNSDTSMPEVTTKWGLILFKLGPFTSAILVWFPVNLGCGRYVWKLLKLYCKRVPRFTHPHLHHTNLRISDLDSQEVKHQIQGLLWASHHRGCRIILGGDMPSALSVQPSPIHTNKHLPLYKDIKKGSRLDWFTFIAFLWPPERKPPAQKTLDNHLSRSCPAAEKWQMTKTSNNSTLWQ